MKVAIIGLGFVGNSLLNGLKDTVQVKEIDPKLGTNINELKDFSPEIIFICVPTPMSEDKTQDISIIESVVDEINDFKISSLVVLKSTLLPSLPTLSLAQPKRDARHHLPGAVDGIVGSAPLALDGLHAADVSQALEVGIGPDCPCLPYEHPLLIDPQAVHLAPLTPANDIRAKGQVKQRKWTRLGWTDPLKPAHVFQNGQQGRLE